MKPIIIYLSKKEIVATIIFSLIGLGSSVAMVIFAPVEQGIKVMIIVAIAILLLVVFVALYSLSKSRLIIEEDKVTLIRGKKMQEFAMDDIEFVKRDEEGKRDILMKVKDEEKPFRFPFSMKMLEAFYKRGKVIL